MNILQVYLICPLVKEVLFEQLSSFVSWRRQLINSKIWRSSFLWRRWPWRSGTGRPASTAMSNVFARFSTREMLQGLWAPGRRWLLRWWVVRHLSLRTCCWPFWQKHRRTSFGRSWTRSRSTCAKSETAGSTTTFIPPWLTSLTL